jgi:hypothetical protein
MTRIATHSKIVEFHKEISEAYLGINGFYRFDITELTGQLRKGINTPVLMLESHSTDMVENSNKTVTFANKRVSFLLLDFAGKVDNYEKRDQVLENLENIALDIAAFLKKCRNDKTHWLYGLIDIDSIQIEKVGPILDNMFGWNVIYTLKNHEPMCYDATKWDWNPIPIPPVIETIQCPHESRSYYLLLDKFINASDNSVINIKNLTSTEIIEMWKDNVNFKSAFGESGIAKCENGFAINDKTFTQANNMNIVLPQYNGYWLADASNEFITYSLIQQNGPVSLTSRKAPTRTSVLPIVTTAVNPVLIKILNGIITEVIPLPLNQFVLN